MWIRRIPDLEPESVIRQDDRWWQTHQALVQRYPEPQPSEVERADALVLDSPGYFGSMSAALKHWLETEFIRLWRGEEISEKAGAAFCTTSTLHGGNEMTIFSMLTALMHLSCVVVPAG